jgi:hypothetical protein
MIDPFSHIRSGFTSVWIVQQCEFHVPAHLSHTGTGRSSNHALLPG